jgi:hypothetical protein
MWLLYSGYQNISLTKKLGTEVFAEHVATSTGLLALATDTKQVVPDLVRPRVVTHIKTPERVRAIYMSSWVAGTPSIRNRLVELVDTTELNAVVIDVKDNTGVITWDSRMKDMDAFIDELHAKNIYVIARIAAFQDPYYVKLHPDQAVHSKKSGGVWKDRKGIPWVDTGSKKMWYYLETISKEAYARGFDEINLDYIRFPTDGDLNDMTFLVSGQKGEYNKPAVVAEFYEYITSALRKENIPVSGDVFGIITTSNGDIPVLGQDFHVALKTFDYVAPMVYPSHYAAGTFGYQNPAKFPKEVIHNALTGAINIADQVASSTGAATSTLRAKIRPWYQDFDMGAVYTKEMVRAQIDAGEALGISSWMLWDPANKYTPSALQAQ